MVGTVVKLTPGEALLIARRRVGYNQLQTAQMYGVPSDLYRAWEMDRRPDGPRIDVGEPKDYELCTVARRRAGLKQRELAAALGVSRIWVHMMETGTAPADRLREHWGI